MVEIAAATFSMYAFQELKKQLENIEELKFIFTSPTFVKEKIKKERKEFYIPSSIREKNLAGTDFEVKLRNELTQKAIAKECSQWIKNKVKFKSTVDNRPMPKIMNVYDNKQQTTYFNVDEFSATELGYEKNNAYPKIISGNEDYGTAKAFIENFSNQWHDESLQDITNQVIEYIESLYEENAPEFIYYITLYNIFNEFLEDINEDYIANERTGFKDTIIWNKLYNFQKDAVEGAINKIEKYNGCIIADSVGLGKTFSALGVIKYYELKNGKVLVLCPKKLGDNWKTYTHNVKNNIFANDRFAYDVLYHTDLSRDGGESNGILLDNVNWGNYDLIVIDESHNFRNNNARKDRETRYQKLMNNIIKDGIKTKVLMLSATPVNNKFTDLKNQINFIYEADNTRFKNNFESERSIESITNIAQKQFNEWRELPPNERTTKNLLNKLSFDFFKLLDSVTIARSKKHIERYYDDPKMGKFPEKLKPISITEPLTYNKDFLMSYKDINEILLMMNLSVYTPTNYIWPAKREYYAEMYDIVTVTKSTFKQVDREDSLKRLMQINLLKRLESSVEAFRLTLSRLLTNITNTINKIDSKDIQIKQSVFDVGYGSFDESDDYIDDQMSIGEKVKINLEDIDTEKWKFDLDQDKDKLIKLLQKMNKISPEYDSKLIKLKQLISNKIKSPINGENKKVVVFSAFADTAKYLYKHLNEFIYNKNGLYSALITGSENKTNFKCRTDFNTILTNFSPISKERELFDKNTIEEIDLLVGTDCISEGQNLQDGDYLINYDIHWNPVRIIQRFGRIDRIGSKNTTIQLVNFWPEMELDEYIKLKERVESRMKILDMSAGGGENVLENNQYELEYRKKQLMQLQEEVLDIEEMDTGVSITDLGLTDFRVDLANYTKLKGDLSNTPMGLHAVVKKQEDMQKGVIFVLKNINDDINIDKINRLHPFYIVYIANNGNIVTNHLNVKQTLDIYRKLCFGSDKPDKQRYDLFNKKTNDGKDMSKYSDLLEKTIKSIIQVKEEKDIISIFKAGGTNLLINEIKGLDDFELITFLVIE